MSGRRFIQTDFDIRLGRIIETTRIRHGMSQKDVAKILGVSFQQVQKYEAGENRISARSLSRIAAVFEMTVGQMIDGVNAEYLHDMRLKKMTELYFKLNTHQKGILTTLMRYMAHSTYGYSDKTTAVIK